jgi:AraC-like DNA-binding protein
LYGEARHELLAKIAIALRQALARRATDGTPGSTTAITLARGVDWTVEDVICTSGPHDRPFEEQHSHVSLAVVVAGSFQYRCRYGREVLTPGSVLLGNAGECFVCGHDHGAGDRCIAFRYAPDYFARLASDAGMTGGRGSFHTPRLPPLRELSPLVAGACVELTESIGMSWEALSLTLAARVVQVAGGLSRGSTKLPRGSEARVTRVVRAIERQPDATLTIEGLARAAGLSPYHFLRTFERVTGVTPHQYVLRTRLRDAAMRLTAGNTPIVEVALDCGFGDLSNFNRAFRREFGLSPSRYRASGG